jgi:curli biogenesis system outer membrane secretion channel CsgG
MFLSDELDLIYKDLKSDYSNLSEIAVKLLNTCLSRIKAQVDGNYKNFVSSIKSTNYAWVEFASKHPELKKDALVNHMLKTLASEPNVSKSFKVNLERDLRSLLETVKPLR